MSATPHGIGVYLAVVQFLFTLTWTVYVIFLPQLAGEVGIAKDLLIFIVMADQLIFAVMDLGMGLASDRLSRAVGRLGNVAVSLTALSCLAFLLLPHVTKGGPGMQWLFGALIVVWAVTSSALRAPPLMLLGKYATAPAVPRLASLSLLGLGLAAAVSPYLTVTLRQVDPRLPFALSSIALILATLGIVRAERALASRAATPTAPAAAPPSVSTVSTGTPVDKPMIAFLVGVALVGLGFQIHFALNSAPLYLKFAKPAELPSLMPVFWIGFNLLIVPASWWTARSGGVMVMGSGAIAGAVLALGAANVPSLPLLIGAQFLAGAAWGCVLMSAVAAAQAIGHTGREGTITGGLFCLLALATFARMGLVAAELNKSPAVMPLLPWAPVALWFVGGALLLAVVARQRRVVAAGLPSRA